MKKYLILLTIIILAIGCSKDKESVIHKLNVCVDVDPNSIGGSTVTFMCYVNPDNLIGDIPLTQKGVCWSTSHNPTLDDNHTEEGSGYGVFNARISGLQYYTTYFVRAYATNEQGTEYSSELSFVTRGTPDATVNGIEIYWENAPSSSQKNMIVNLIQDMVYVEGGSFIMGAQNSLGGGDNYDLEAYSNESPIHNVTVRSYYMCRSEFSQSQYKNLVGSGSLAWTTSRGLGDNFPAYYLSYDEVQSLIYMLWRYTNLPFSLPTEAQWEYAARGGNYRSSYRYSGSDNVSQCAWYSGNSNNSTYKIRCKTPNALGIYDMSGNVAEWCLDYYDGYSGSAQTNPTGPSNGLNRVLRGGSCYKNSRDVRVSSRNYAYPTNRFYDVGFRLVLNY